MLYNYAQYVQSSLETELDFCHHRSAGLWNEYGAMTGVRGKRAVMHRSDGMTGRMMPRARARAAGSYAADAGAGGYGGASSSGV